MKYISFVKRFGANHRRGFTLTEVLLAVMIVGLIGVALASLTRAAARESGVGRSKVMLRNNLSTFLRTLRRDINQSTRVDYVGGAVSCSSSGVALLQLAQNVDSAGNALIFSVTNSAATSSPAVKYITYCFLCGSDTANIVPSGAKRGGAIYRLESGSKYTIGDGACSSLASSNLLLNNVKYISGSYPVPWFSADAISRTDTNSVLTVHVITELNSKPIVNDVIEETFAMPMGY